MSMTQSCLITCFVIGLTCTNELGAQDLVRGKSFILGTSRPNTTFSRPDDLPMILSFTDDHSRIISCRSDGQILEWSLKGESRDLGQTKDLFAYSAEKHMSIIRRRNDDIVLMMHHEQNE